MATGKWEGRIKIPTGGWTFTLADSGASSPHTVSFTAANTYYHSSVGNDSNDFPAAVAAAMNSASDDAGTYSCSIDGGESGTGKYTITLAGSGNFAITWVDGDLRDLLGWTGDISAAATYTSPEQAEGLWFPQCPVETPYHLDSDGRRVTDAVSTLAPDGTYKRYVYGSFTRNEYLYRAVTQAHAIQAAESTVNESFERFYNDCIDGDQAWAEPGKALRWYQDADDDATFKTVNAIAGSDPFYDRFGQTADWDGLWTVRIPVSKNV